MEFDEFMARIERGERLRPIKWRNASLLHDAYVVRSGALFHSFAPKTVAVSVSPWQVGAQEQYEKWGNDWEISADIRNDPYGAYKCRFIAKYEHLQDILDLVRCDKCIDVQDGAHGTCPHCLFHGDFDEPGECIKCPKCTWGHAT